MMREGESVAQCTAARLMKDMGLRGVIRGKPVKTTVSDRAAHARSIRSIGGFERRGRMPCCSPTSPASQPGPVSSMGGFKRSSQHQDLGGFDDYSPACVGSARSKKVVLTRTPFGMAA